MNSLVGQKEFGFYFNCSRKSLNRVLLGGKTKWV